ARRGAPRLRARLALSEVEGAPARHLEAAHRPPAPRAARAEEGGGRRRAPCILHGAATHARAAPRRRCSTRSGWPAWPWPRAESWLPPALDLFRQPIELFLGPLLVVEQRRHGLPRRAL